MENKDTKYDMSGFDSVWQRVTSSDMKEIQPSGCPSDEKALREFMDDEASDAEYYRCLARKMSRCCAQTLMGISADETRHLKQLQASYFILTGDTYIPLVESPEITSICDSLRTRYIAEVHGATEYLRAASETDNPELASLYRGLAVDETRHSETIKKMICAML